jgi:hypothetical protein
VCVQDLHVLLEESDNLNILMFLGDFDGPLAKQIPRAYIRV